jgi:hypothetical protein
LSRLDSESFRPSISTVSSILLNSLHFGHDTGVATPLTAPRVILLFDVFGNGPVLKGWDEDFAASSDLEGCD